VTLTASLLISIVNTKQRVERQTLGLDYTILVLQQNRSCWYGHVLWEEDNDWVKKCVESEVEGARPRGRPEGTWREVIQKDCQVCKLNREDAIDRSW